MNSWKLYKNYNTSKYKTHSIPENRSFGTFENWLWNQNSIQNWFKTPSTKENFCKIEFETKKTKTYYTFIRITDQNRSNHNEEKIMKKIRKKQKKTEKNKKKIQFNQMKNYFDIVFNLL